MLTARELIVLERALRDQQVLSVYIDGRVTDPAERAHWRAELDAALDDVRESLRDATHAEREAFENAGGALSRELATVVGAIGAPGCVAFATGDGVRRLERLPVSVPLRVEWRTGIVLAPALRALKESRPAFVAVVDARSARVYEYRHAKLEKVETLRAHARVEAPSHMGGPPRTGFHTGTRGRTGTDAAARERRVGREHMMHELASRLVKLAGADGWILLGGTPQAREEALSALPRRLASRARIVPELHLRATDAEIAEHAAAAAAELRRGEDLAVAQRVLERAGASGRGTTRLADTRTAVDAGEVQQLLITLRFLEQHPREAEELVRAAAAQRASVEVVSGDGAGVLDANADGVGAVLRFRGRSKRAAKPETRRERAPAPESS